MTDEQLLAVALKAYVEAPRTRDGVPRGMIAAIAAIKPLIAAVARDNTKLALWFVCPPLAAVVTAGDWLKLWTGAR